MAAADFLTSGSTARLAFDAAIKARASLAPLVAQLPAFGSRWSALETRAQMITQIFAGSAPIPVSPAGAYDLARQLELDYFLLGSEVAQRLGVANPVASPAAVPGLLSRLVGSSATQLVVAAAVLLGVYLAIRYATKG